MRCCWSVFCASDDWAPEELGRRLAGEVPEAAGERGQRRCRILDAGHLRANLERTSSCRRCRVNGQSLQRYKNYLELSLSIF